MTTTHYRACNLCEAICGLEIIHDQGKIISIRGDKNDPLSKGHICPKAAALQDLQEDPDRLRRPVIKNKDGVFEPVDWDTALKAVADGLAPILKTYGRDSVATYQGNPVVHNLGLLTHAGAFLGLLKSRKRFSATSVDQLPAQLVCHWFYGHAMRVAVPDVTRTDLMIIIGANPLASNGSLMTAPGMRHHLKAISVRGEVVVIDPKRTATAKVADQHHFITPGEDAAFLLSMLHVLFEENLINPGKLETVIDGIADIKALLHRFAPESTAAKTGIAPDITRDLARKLATTKRAVLYGRMGISVQKHGTLCNWAMHVLNLLTGHVDSPGGLMFANPAIDMAKAPMGRPSHFANYHSSKRGLPEFNGELPSVTMAEEIEGDEDQKIRAFVTMAGNPVLSVPDGNRLDKALQGLDFMVSFDNWINETTRHANVILPGSGPLQKAHYDLIFNSFAVQNYARWSDPMLPLEEDEKHDHQVLTEAGNALAAALGVPPRAMPDPETIITGMLAQSPYQGVDMTALKDSQHGLDLGALEPVLPDGLMTPDQRIALLQPGIESDMERLAASLSIPIDGLLMIGRRDVRSNNSWMHNAPRLVKGKDHSRVEIHPNDAAPLGIKDGDPVTLTTNTGSITPKANITDDIKPGVICMPHGWGHNKEGTKLSTATMHAGTSVNDIIADNLIDPISGNAAVQAVPVWLDARTQTQ